MNVEELIRQADAFVKVNNLQEAESAYLAATQADPRSDAAWYGLGVIHVVRGDTAGAKPYFTQAVHSNPNHANALFYLAQMAEGGGQKAEAISFYLNVIRINPHHQAAAESLQALGVAIILGHAGYEVDDTPRPPHLLHEEVPAHDSTRAATPAQTPAQAVDPDSASQADPDELGAYEFLRRKATVESKEALDAMHRLNLDARPNISAYLGPICSATLKLWVVLGVCLIFGDKLAGRFLSQFTPEHRPFEASLPLFAETYLAAFVLVFSITVVVAKCKRFTVSQARVTLESGVFTKGKMSEELSHLEDVVLNRGLMQRFTGDGTLILHFRGQSGKKIIVLTGIYRGLELDKKRLEFINIRVMLRTFPELVTMRQ